MNINIREYKNFVNNLSEDVIDVLGDDCTGCFMFAYYIHNKYNLPIMNYEPVYGITITREFILDKNRIYSYYMYMNTEIHHFILDINNDGIILVSTYGGQKNIIKMILSISLMN